MPVVWKLPWCDGQRSSPGVRAVDLGGVERVARALEVA
jgi:hypothetical protein